VTPRAILLGWFGKTTPMRFMTGVLTQGLSAPVIKPRRGK
jgi:hypothetical protein